MVPALLQKYYGCSMTAHGIYMDSSDVPRSFELRLALEKFRVSFEGVKAMWFTWWTQTQSRLVPVDTALAYKYSGDEKANLRPNHGFFVMTFGRDLYVAPHSSKISIFLKFHSTVPGGAAVQGSGSWAENRSPASACTISRAA